MNYTFLLPLLAACCAGAAATPNWPQFHGPNSSGVAESDKPPVEFGPETNLLWKIEVPAGLSSPCVWGDRIFLTAAEGEKLVTLAVNRRDGKELWRKTLPGLYARNGSGTSPALLGGKLVLNCDVEEDKSFIAAFEPATGKELWRTARADFHSGYTTPIRWQREGRDDVVVVGSLRVVGYNLGDGRERWTVGGTEAVSVAPTPVIGDGKLYVMSRSFSGAKLPAFALMDMPAEEIFGLAGVDKLADGAAAAMQSFTDQI